MDNTRLYKEAARILNSDGRFYELETGKIAAR